MIPKPFSGVLLRFGPLEPVAAEMDEQEFEDCRLKIEKQLELTYEEIDRYWAAKRKTPTGFTCIPVE